MTQESYPLLTNADPQQVADMLREMARLRERDIEDFANLKNIFMRGRKVAKIPTASTDIVAADREGDFNFDLNYIYICVDTGSGLAWRRTAVESWVAPFDFSDVTSATLAAWFDASDESTITDSSGATTQWDDKSGNGNHALQSVSTSYGPTTGTRTINGLNALDFDGGDDYLALTSSISYTSGYTVFIVVEGDDFSGTNEKVLISGDTGANFELRIETSPAGIVQIIKRNTGIYAQLTSALPTATPGIISARSGVSGNDLELNGVGVSNATATSYTGDIKLIGRQGSPPDYFNGLIAEIGIFTGIMDLTDLNSCGNYLADKWGRTWTEVT